MKGFGLDRVIEPKGNIPVTAWKLDNSMKLKPKEMKISVEIIDFERSNFNQICSICGYDEEQIKKMELLIEHLEDNDDVQNIYHNWDMPEEAEEE